MFVETFEKIRENFGESSMVPDAMFLHRRTRKPLAALEYTGKYRPERLRGFHCDMAARDDIPSYFLF